MTRYVLIVLRFWNRRSDLALCILYCLLSLTESGTSPIPFRNLSYFSLMSPRSCLRSPSISSRNSINSSNVIRSKFSMFIYLPPSNYSFYRFSILPPHIAVKPIFIRAQRALAIYVYRSHSSSISDSISVRDRHRDRQTERERVVTVVVVVVVVIVVITVIIAIESINPGPDWASISRILEAVNY